MSAKRMGTIVVLAVLSLCGNRAGADILARYDFTGEPGDQLSTAAAVADANLSASALTRGSGLTARAGTNSMNSSSWSTALTLEATDYYEVTLTPDSGYALTLNTIYYRYATSGTGPQNEALRTSLDGFASDIAAGGLSTNATVDVQWLNLAVVHPELAQQSTGITFRIYAWNAGSSAGTWRLQNHPSANGLVFEGIAVAVPEPSSALLLLAAGMGCWLHRRARH